MLLRVVFVFVVLINLAGQAAAATSPTPVPGPMVDSGIELSELLADPVAPLTDDHDEFVEVHNTTTAAMSLKGYAIKVGTHSFVFGDVPLEADGYTVVTSGGSTLSLSNSGATVVLYAPDGSTSDLATYGAAKVGQSWAKLDDVWGWNPTPTSGQANAAMPVVTPTATPAQASSSPSAVPGMGSGSRSASPILITELLPDPAAPLSDDHDEFIELMNPSGESVDLTGYVLKVGKTLSSHYTLSGMIAAGSYAVFTSGQTHLQLANAGSSVALYDAKGVQVDSTVSYVKAAAGQTWARFTDGWSYTTTPTPGTDNIFSVPAVKAASTSATTSKGSTSKAVTSKAKSSSLKAVTAKPSKKLSSKVSTGKIKNSTTKPVAAIKSASAGAWLLWLLLSLTIGFIIYEFRHDVIDLYHRARGHFRRGPRAS